jgi:hypothetical protein
MPLNTKKDARTAPNGPDGGEGGKLPFDGHSWLFMGIGGSLDFAGHPRMAMVTGSFVRNLSEIRPFWRAF